VIDESIVKRLPKETLIIDLASAPGGVDIRAAKEYGITVLPAQSLPGKYSPQTAGEIIAQTITCILEEEGIGR
jgi:dipicolinate synthase subunit A